ncbi:unnamed protein product [Linum tenue]|uniref:Peptidase A2 domain-containing protein n=1 Tax=Linum tenue TaxID=586396 RepID=A0AAV0S0E4_9ROSI|nr:unnamed protein product [Linum tenue]
MEATKVIAKDLGFFLTHSSTKSNDGEKYPRIYLHRHRGYKNNTYVPDPDKKGRSNTKSLKDGCRFRVRLVGLPEDKTTLDDVPMSRVLVDNGAAVNVMPTRMLKKLGKNTNDLIPTEVFVTSFNGGSTSARGILPVVVGVGSQKRMSAFFVVDGMISYNALLGRDWIHANKCVPSSLHQCLMFWNEDGVVEVVQADTKPFAVGANVAEAYLYHGDFGPLEIRSGDGGTTNVIVSSAQVLSKACLDPLSEIVRPSMITLDGPPKSVKQVDDE